MEITRAQRQVERLLILCLEQVLHIALQFRRPCWTALSCRRQVDLQVVLAVTSPRADNGPVDVTDGDAELRDLGYAIEDPEIPTHARRAPRSSDIERGQQLATDFAAAERLDQRFDDFEVRGVGRLDFRTD